MALSSVSGTEESLVPAGYLAGMVCEALGTQLFTGLDLGASEGLHLAHKYLYAQRAEVGERLTSRDITSGNVKKENPFFFFDVERGPWNFYFGLNPIKSVL